MGGGEIQGITEEDQPLNSSIWPIDFPFSHISTTGAFIDKIQAATVFCVVPAIEKDINLPHFIFGCQLPEANGADLCLLEFPPLALESLTIPATIPTAVTPISNREERAETKNKECDHENKHAPSQSKKGRPPAKRLTLKEKGVSGGGLVGYLTISYTVFGRLPCFRIFPAFRRLVMVL